MEGGEGRGAVSTSWQYLLVPICTVVFMYCVGGVWGLGTGVMAVAISYCVIYPAAQDGHITRNQGQHGVTRNQGQHGVNGNQEQQDVLNDHQPGFHQEQEDINHEHQVRAQRQDFNATQRQALKDLLAQTRHPTSHEIDQLMVDDAFRDEQVARDKVTRWFSRINVQAKELLDEANEEISALTQALGRQQADYRRGTVS